ncbi:MAG: hypothetical protein NZ898_04480 [Myxococcota bacterium]|nr:hypothetical protein [Myxococcota bacterium]MDW8362050.1 hypothetical protein [Myxococcales bacterium]
MTKLAEFLDKNRIGTRLLLSVSHTLESRRPEDRAIARARRAVKAGDASDAVKERAKNKPRSGRPVTARALEAARAGEAVSGPTKTRILRAINAILSRRRQPEVGLRDLFG